MALRAIKAAGFCALFGLFTLTAPQAGAAECRGLETGIDREKLIFYVNDGLKADAIGRSWDDLAGRLSGADDWLAASAYRTQDVAEAVVNARRVTKLVLEKVPNIQAQLDAMPDKGPEFPPIFFWPEGWKRMARAVNDSIRLEAESLAAEAEAHARGDGEEAARIAIARAADMGVFQGVFNAFDQEMLRSVPKAHPEFWLIRMRTHWQGMSDLRVERESARSMAENRAVSLKVARKYTDIAEAMTGDLAEMRKQLDGHRLALAPFFLTLTCDQTTADTALDIFMASLERHATASQEMIGVLKDYGELELTVWRDGPSDAIFERYDVLGFRYEAANAKLSAEWSVRAKLLAESVAGE